MARQRSFSEGVVEIPRTLCFPDIVPQSHKLRAINRFLRNVFARETLGVAAPAPPSASPRRRFAALLLGREALPEDPPAPPNPRRPGLLHALFVPERLPELPPAPPRPPRSAWLRWLFRVERIDPP